MLSEVTQIEKDKHSNSLLTWAGALTLLRLEI